MVNEVPDLVGALHALARAADALRGLPPETLEARRRLSTEAGTHLARRVEDPGPPVVVSVAGLGGAGKSAVVNALVGSTAVREGFVRPMTIEPTVVTSDGLVPSYLSAYPSTIAQDCLLRDVALVDLPASADIHEVSIADLVILVVTPERYADATTWGLMRELLAYGVPIWLVANRATGADDEIILDLRALLTEAGLDVPVHALALRTPEEDEDENVPILRDVLQHMVDNHAETVRSAIAARTDALVGRASQLIDDIDAAAAVRQHLQDKVAEHYDAAVANAAEIASPVSLAASAGAPWVDIVERMASLLAHDLGNAAHETALAWDRTELGEEILETEAGSQLWRHPEESMRIARISILSWRDDISRRVQSRWRGRKNQGRCEEVVEVVRRLAIGEFIEVPRRIRRRLTVPIDELAAECQQVLSGLLSDLVVDDAQRFHATLGSPPATATIAKFEQAVTALADIDMDVVTLGTSEAAEPSDDAPANDQLANDQPADDAAPIEDLEPDELGDDGSIADLQDGDDPEVHEPPEVVEESSGAVEDDLRGFTQLIGPSSQSPTSDQRDATPPDEGGVHE